MARFIKFCNMQVYQGGVQCSEIFEVSDISRLDAELRVISASGTSPSITGAIQTTSDASFDDAAWQNVGGTGLSTTSGTTLTGAYSGLGRFVRARITVQGTNAYVTACFQAMGRDV
jgi:hypothetical protein